MELHLLDEIDRHQQDCAADGEHEDPAKLKKLKKLALKYGKKTNKTQARWRSSLKHNRDGKKQYNQVLKKKVSQKTLAALRLETTTDEGREFLVDGEYVGIHTPVTPSSEDE